MTRAPLVRTASTLQRWCHSSEAVLVVLILSAGTAIRMLHLDASPLWVDEAESSINALTILAHGYPTDEYLGMPIYENTLIQPWPESPEYEFRDVSYSDKHFAIYHGWLPLYAIAGSFALHGIESDKPDGVLSTKHSLWDQKRRSRAARLPSLLFGCVFLLMAFAGGKALYGAEAAWAALIVGSVHPWTLTLFRQARYYSAQIAMTTICCVLLWQLIQECRWKHVYLTALAFVLLFHTHIVSFAAAAIVLSVSVLLILRRHNAAVRKMLILAALITGGTLPWILVTGFYSHQSRIPRAWPMLDIPADLLRYPPIKLPYAVVGMLILMLAAWVILFKPHVSSRFSAPMKRLWPVALFLIGWAACGYAAFTMFIPAASFAAGRMNLMYWGPLFLVGSVMSAALARVIAPRHSSILAPVMMLAIFFATGHTLEFPQSSGAVPWSTYAAILQQLDSMRLNSTTRLYAAPNDHLILAFYSGLPIQDITPVRKSYLDSYRGDIVYIDSAISVDTGMLVPERIQQAARHSRFPLTFSAAENWSMLLRTRDYRVRMLSAIGASSPPQIESVPSFAQTLVADHNRRVSSVFSAFGLEVLTRGFIIRDWSEWRNVLRFRFVNPTAHMGVHANYANRLCGAEATILAQPKSDTVIYRAKWHPSCVQNGIAYRFVPL